MDLPNLSYGFLLERVVELAVNQNKEGRSDTQGMFQLGHLQRVFWREIYIVPEDDVPFWNWRRAWHKVLKQDEGKSLCLRLAQKLLIQFPRQPTQYKALGCLHPTPFAQTSFSLFCLMVSDGLNLALSCSFATFGSNSRWEYFVPLLLLII